MITLTQEKREELIEQYSQQIETFKYHLSQIGTDHFDGKAYSEILLKTEIALESLMPKPFGYVDRDAVEVGESLFSTTLYADTENLLDCTGDKNPVPLYLCPPLPEIKLPNELNDLVNAVEFYNKVKAENPTIETGAWNDAYDWIKKAAIKAAPVIKRLNGLGE